MGGVDFKDSAHETVSSILARTRRAVVHIDRTGYSQWTMAAS